LLSGIVAHRPMLASRSWRDVKDLAGLAKQDTVPDTLRYYNSLPWPDLNSTFRTSFLKHEVNVSGNEKQYFVAIWVHLSTVGSVSRHHGRSDQEPIDPPWGPWRLWNQLSRAVALQPDGGL
jgi:hypothetical protein